MRGRSPHGIVLIMQKLLYNRWKIIHRISPKRLKSWKREAFLDHHEFFKCHSTGAYWKVFIYHLNSQVSTSVNLVRFFPHLSFLEFRNLPVPVHYQLWIDLPEISLTILSYIHRVRKIINLFYILQANTFTPTAENFSFLLVRPDHKTLMAASAYPEVNPKLTDFLNY